MFDRSLLLQENMKKNQRDVRDFERVSQKINEETSAEDGLLSQDLSQTKGSNEEKIKFIKFVQFMFERKEYTWEDFREQYYANLKQKDTFWSRFKKQEDGKEREEFDKIDAFVSSLAPNEYEKTDFKWEDIATIKEATELTMDEIVHIRYNFGYYRGVHHYLTWLKNNGKAIPETHEEFTRFLERDNPKFIRDIQMMAYNYIKEKMAISPKKVEKFELRKQREYYKLKKTYQY